MSKHTQGPWEVSGTTRGLNGLYIKADNKHIAQVFSSIPECEANAKLIAAAPEMLDALFSAVLIIDKLGIIKSDTTLSNDIKKIYNAINKATT